ALRACAPVDGGGAGFEQPLGRRPRSHLGPRGERHVEPLPGIGRARDEGELAAGHLSLRARGPSITYRRPRIPSTIATSARLKAGQKTGLMKSITEPSLIGLPAWSTPTTAPATAPASRHARIAGLMPGSGACDRVRDELAHDDQQEGPEHRAEVDRGGTEPGERKEAAEEVEIRVD